MEKQLTQKINRLDDLFQKIKKIRNEEIQSHYARYLCILTSGFIETSVRIILEDYINKKSAPIVAEYLSKHFKRITNLKDSHIQKLLEKFTVKWANEYEKSRSPEQKAALDSIVANRNEISHGKNVGITYIRIKEYYVHTKKVIQLLKRIIS